MKVDAIIDSREPAEVPVMFDEHPDVQSWEPEQMPEGDITFEGTSLLIERKDLNDFVGSMKDGRLYSQLERMEEAADRVFVLVEGDMDGFEALEHTQMTPESIRGFMASIMVRYGVPVVLCGDLRRLVDLSVRIGRKEQERPSSGYLSAGAIEDTSAPLPMRMYGCMPGVGPTTAEALYDRFPSIERAFDASVDEFQEIDGIGEVTAGEIFDSLRATE